MKLTRVTWDHYKNGLPKSSATYLDTLDYELEHIPQQQIIRARHRLTGAVYRVDQTGSVMLEAPEERPVVPVAAENSGTSRTTKSSKR